MRVGTVFSLLEGRATLPVPIIAINAITIQPGGGLSVVQQIADAVATLTSYQFTIYVGSSDVYDDLKKRTSDCQNIQIFPILLDKRSTYKWILSKAIFFFGKRAREIDLVISINYWLLTKCPLLTYHINLLNFESPSNTRFSISSYLRRIDALLACRFSSINAFESHYLAESAFKATNGQIRNSRVLYAGLSEIFFREIPEKNQAFAIGNFTRDSRVLLLVSSPQPHKDNALALEILEYVARKSPQDKWRLLVCGGQAIHQWDAFLRQAAKLGIAELVTIVGPIPKEVLRQYIEHSTCLINPSQVESFCMVALEAMAVGCPVIVTNRTAMPESVADAGIVIPERNVTSFGNVVLRVAKDDKYRNEFIQKGKARALLFHPHRFSEALAALIHKMTYDLDGLND